MALDCAADALLDILEASCVAEDRFGSEADVLDTDVRVEKAMARYQNIYISLYGRTPRELRDLGNTRVLVNGAQMRIDELENLTEELQKEYQQVLANKRNIVKKLLNWFAKP